MKEKSRPQIVTQQDIADALGIARSTVAMALNPLHEHKLLANTVLRIKQYAAKVGYRPQRSAQIMRGARTRIIGVVVRASTNNQELVARLANELNHAGYRLVLVDPQWFGGNFEDVKNYLLDQAVEGVVFCNLVQPTEAKSMQETLPPGLPVVSLQSSLEGVSNIRADIYTAYYEMTRYHLVRGHRRLCHLLNFRDSGVLDRLGWTARNRAAGFVQAIRDAGGTIYADDAVGELLEIPAYVSTKLAADREISGTIIEPEKESHIHDGYENGYHQTVRLLETEQPPDCLICVNDDTALGAYAACADFGWRVPEQVSITGCDDTAASRFAAIPLTTIQRPLGALAAHTAQRIIELIEMPAKGGDEFSLLPCTILIRRSSGGEFSNDQLLEEHGTAEFRATPDRRLEFGSSASSFQR